LLHIRRTLFLLSPPLFLSLPLLSLSFSLPPSVVLLLSLSLSHARYAWCALRRLASRVSQPPRGRRTRESAPTATLSRPTSLPPYTSSTSSSSSSCTSSTSSASPLVSPHRARECKPPLPPTYTTYTTVGPDALLTGNVSFRAAALPFLFRDRVGGHPPRFLHAGATGLPRIRGVSSVRRTVRRSRGWRRGQAVAKVIDAWPSRTREV